MASTHWLITISTLPEGKVSDDLCSYLDPSISLLAQLVARRWLVAERWALGVNGTCLTGAERSWEVASCLLSISFEIFARPLDPIDLGRGRCYIRDLFESCARSPGYQCEEAYQQD